MFCGVTSVRSAVLSKSIISILFLHAGTGLARSRYFSLRGCVYVIHFLIVAAIAAGALPVPAADRFGSVVFLHGSAGGRGGR